jgi:hypothetical protein
LGAMEQCAVLYPTLCCSHDTHQTKFSQANLPSVLFADEELWMLEKARC